MTGLSLSAINATSPYQLRVSELGGFDFDIEAGLTYNIALIEDYTFGEGFETYMLNVLSALKWVMNGRAEAPPAMFCKIGVSTSV